MARVSRKATLTETGMDALAAVPEKVYNAAVYVRLSSEDNGRIGDKESIAMQQYMLEKYIEAQPDMRLQGVYCDNGETGTDFARPGFEQMMDRVRDREADCIVVKDLSRFGRNYVETGYYLEKIFPYLGVRFIAVNDGYDTLRGGGGNEMVLSLKNLVNDLYAKDISRKVISSFHAKRENGEYVGAALPYGYRKSPEDKHKLVIDPDAASVMRCIFQWQAAGMGVAQIVRKLNEEGIPNPALYYYQKGYTNREPSETDRLWKVLGVRRMLANPVYAGHMAQGKTKKSLNEGIPKMNVPRDEWIVVKNTHQPIIDQETFDKVQVFLEKRCSQSLAIRGKHETTENVFKGLLVCADCGRKMVRHKNVSAKGTARYTFVCSVYGQNRGKRGCTKKYVKEQDIQEAVISSLCLQIEIAADMERMMHRLQKRDRIFGHRKELQDKIISLCQKIKRNTGLRSALYESLCDGTLTKAEYLSLKEEYDQKAGEFETELSGLQKEAKEYEDRFSSWKVWIASLKGYCFFLKGENSVSDRCQNERVFMQKMTQELVRSIRVSGYNDLEIVWNFQDVFEYMAEMTACAESGGKEAY
ncbi:MAG: recombinase family protein [Butyrivibrio sp.]|nr:recombinase family protein [Butyrivibrio sp.]